MDPEDLLVIKQALGESPRVDAERIDVIFAPGESAVMLVGAVGDTAEAAAAESIASQYADRVMNELRIDPWLREGIPHSGELEPTVPAEGEVLVGATDMLAGPEPESMTDQLEGFSENQPWDPPEQPVLPPTAAEWVLRASMGDGDLPEDDLDGEADTEEVRRTDYAAADLTREELAMGLRGARVPSLPPDTDPATLAVPDPTATERTEPADEEPGPELLPGATPGPEYPGAGDLLGGEPALETGARGMDTGPADPARALSGSGAGAGGGGGRGPQARDDETVREDLPEDFPPHLDL